MPDPHRTALAAGVVGRLGEALLEALLASPRYRQVYVATRFELTSTLPELLPLAVDQHWQQPLPEICDLYCCVDQRAGFYGRDRAYMPVDRAQLPAIMSAARRSGVSRFALLSGLAPLEQLSVPQGGLRDANELALVRAGFRTLVLLRPSESGHPGSGHPLERLMQTIGGTLAGYLIPQSMQPLRPGLVARAALDAMDRLGPGTHVLNAPAIRELLGMDRAASPFRRSGK